MTRSLVILHVLTRNEGFLFTIFYDKSKINCRFSRISLSHFLTFKTSQILRYSRYLSYTVNHLLPGGLFISSAFVGEGEREGLNGDGAGLIKRGLIII